MRISLLLVILLLLPVAVPVSADELAELRERVTRLEATVEELTLQLAASVRERRRLEAELAETIATAGAAVAAPAAAGSGSTERDAPVLAGEADVAAEEAIEEIAVPSVAASSSDVAPAQPGASDAVDAGYTRSADCDVAQALAGYDGKRKGNEALEAWLQTDNHLDKCSTSQLQQIREAVKWDWLGYEKPVLRLLDRELARR